MSCPPRRAKVRPTRQTETKRKKMLVTKTFPALAGNPSSNAVPGIHEAPHAQKGTSLCLKSGLAIAQNVPGCKTPGRRYRISSRWAGFFPLVGTPFFAMGKELIRMPAVWENRKLNVPTLPLEIQGNPSFLRLRAKMHFIRRAPG